jgi:hypothetical protein
MPEVPSADEPTRDHPRIQRRSERFYDRVHRLLPPFPGEAGLQAIQGAATVEIPFYCSVQTLAQLSGKEMITVEVFKKTYPALYHSAVFHHGGLRQAFEKIGVQYPYEELCDWKDKIKQFLGELPDTIIASRLGKPVRAIRTLRKQFRIPPCRVRKSAFEG